MTDLTHDGLVSEMSYDPNTGRFKRIKTPLTRPDVIDNDPCGMTSDGYYRISIGNKRYRAHRLAWFYMTGQWPLHEIDHINGIRTDNRWANLRSADSATNKHNRHGANRNSTTGLLGVSPAISGKFRARIDAKHIGVYDTPEEAFEAYLQEKRRLHTGCTL